MGYGELRVKHYPLFLNLQDQPVTVIGGGRVATRKIKALLAAGAAVTVISPVATPAIRRLGCSGGGSGTGRLSRAGKQTVLSRNAATPARAARIRLVLRPYRPGDLRGCRLAVAATDCATVNRQVGAEAKRRGILVNCVTEPAAGNFIVPAVVRRGGITAAFSTGGASPALAKQLRRDLEAFLARGYVPRLKRMATQRQRRRPA